MEQPDRPRPQQFNTFLLQSWQFHLRAAFEAGNHGLAKSMSIESCMKGSMRPQVSVLINAYQRTAFLRGAVISVLRAEKYTGKVEIVLVADELAPALEDWLQKSRVQIIWCKESDLGKRVALGLSASEGDIVAFLDDDDEFLPQKIQYLIDVFSDPNVQFYRHPFVLVGEDLTPLVSGPRSYPGPSPEGASNRDRVRLPLSRDVYARLNRTGVLFNLSSMAVRRNAVSNSLAILETLDASLDLALPGLLDSDGWMVLERATPLSLYRVHPSLSLHRLGEASAIGSYLRYMKRAFRTTQRMARSGPTQAIREFFSCQSATLSIGYWALTGDGSYLSRPMPQAVTEAVRCNIAGGNLGAAVFLLGATGLGFISHRLAGEFYRWKTNAGPPSYGRADLALRAGPAS
jgi:hypothetical protein